MTRIYTRGGDTGETGLSDGSRVRKHDARVACCGDVDELNAALGIALAALPVETADVSALLLGVQRELFALGALLADPRRVGLAPDALEDKLALGPAHVLRLERQVDAWELELTPLHAFILPGGHAGAAALHAARAVARRAERSLVAWSDAGAPTGIAVTYLNRLSDTLFVAARLVNRRVGQDEVTW